MEQGRKLKEQAESLIAESKKLIGKDRPKPP